MFRTKLRIVNCNLQDSRWPHNIEKEGFHVKRKKKESTTLHERKGAHCIIGKVIHFMKRMESIAWKNKMPSTLKEKKLIHEKKMSPLW